jgi:succinylglutamate desuccinylase
MKSKRIIGTYTGSEKGPLLFVFGSIHGNEPSGTKAIELFLKMLEVEPITNVDFRFKGKVVGIRGNVRAGLRGLRYIKKDLNRQWTSENIARIAEMPDHSKEEEDFEVSEILQVVKAEIKQYKPDQIAVLDLHSTSAQGIFVIPAEDLASETAASKLQVPMVKGLLCNIQGTTLHYFITQNLGVPTLGICFEAGQHNDPLSVNRAIAVIVNLTSYLGCIDEKYVENQHNQILNNYSAGLPIVTELIYRHPITEADQFVMQPGFVNFQKITKGVYLADDKSGPIYADCDGFILMPLYQQQGVDGFFLVKES